MQSKINRLLLIAAVTLLGCGLLWLAAELTLGRANRQAALEETLDADNSVVHPPAVSREAQAAVARESAKPFYLPADCSFLLLKHKLRESAPFFPFDGVYPEHWPAGFKLPEDTKLLLGSSLTLDQYSSKDKGFNCTVRGVSRTGVAELHEQFQAGLKGLQWDREADNLNEGAEIPGTVPEPDTWFVRYAQWAPAAEAQTMRTGGAVDYSDEFVPTGEYWAMRDSFSISIPDYGDLDGWTYFEILFQRSYDKKWTDPHVQDEYRRRLEEGGL